MVVVIAVIVGLILGSFLSVLLDRWPHLRGAGTGRSHCPHCKHVLAWYDLVPLVSWSALRGRCRYCGEPVSALYPVLELTMAGVLGLSAYISGFPSLWYATDYLILFALVSLFFFDFKYRVLPDFILVPLLIVVAARLFSERPDLLINGFATAAALSGLWGALYLISRGRWLGLGDVKLAFVLGLLFGYPGAVGVMMIAVWSGALAGIGLVLAHRAHGKTPIPFGSFWAAAAIITVIFPGPVFFLSGLITPHF